MTTQQNINYGESEMEEVPTVWFQRKALSEDLWGI